MTLTKSSDGDMTAVIAKKQNDQEKKKEDSPSPRQSSKNRTYEVSKLSPLVTAIIGLKYDHHCPWTTTFITEIISFLAI